MKTHILRFIIILSFTINSLAQWQPDYRLTNASGNSYTSYNNAPSIAINGNTVYVVWYDDRDGNYEIYFKRSTNNGINWETDIRLTSNSAESIFPSISSIGLDLFVAWADDRDGNGEIYFKHSSDGGSNWTADTRLTNFSGSSTYPCIFTSGQNIHLVWVDMRDAIVPLGQPEIYYKHSTDGGVSWGADTRLTNNPAGSYGPSVIAIGQIVVIAWEDLQNNRNEIFYKRSTDNGTNWGATTLLLGNFLGASQYSTVAVSGQNIHVVCKNYSSGSSRIYYKRSTNSGQNWVGELQLVSTVSPVGVEPFIAASGMNVHIAWQDYRDGNYEIYYKRSIDGGTNWSADNRLTNDASVSRRPTISVLDSAVHTIWYDNRDGNFEIYYKRNPIGNVVGLETINSNVPSEFMLEQNFPNPFNPITKIKFHIPRSGFVSLKIYDALGRNVITLINQNLNPGVYEVEWNASEFPSGIYYYKFTAGDFSETRKMILIK